MSEKTKIYLQAIFFLLVFVAGYLVLNHRPIVVGVLYRWAASDYKNAIFNLLLFVVQGGLLWLAFVCLPRLPFVILVFLVFLSGVVNIIYQQVLGNLLDAASIQWMLEELRQLDTAFGEFSNFFLIGFLKTIFAIALMIFSRYSFIRWRVGEGIFFKLKSLRVPLFIVFLLLFFMADVLMTNAGRSRAGEMNIYGALVRQAVEVLPERAPPVVVPATAPVVDKIVLLVDESIGWKIYDKILKPGWISTFSGIDLGEARALSNCSAQSNAALRWGVNVQDTDATTDLRKNSTIWAYAKSAGYRTTLIDGQTLGAPQNYLWTSELALIDAFSAADKGIDTDYQIALDINSILRRPGRDYVFVVLRGAHYQYHDNYPNGELDRHLPKDVQYEKAVTYSKKSFMESVFSGVDRSNTVVFYTSDHGQYIHGNGVPHCNETPVREELSVPLMVFAPGFLSHFQKTAADVGVVHSHSQIFPTSLVLMGYGERYAELVYDALLPLGSKRLLRFGKKMYPRSEGDRIQLFVD